MRRTSLAALAALSILAAPASAAPGGGAIHDPAGDWPVASEDIVSARVAGVVTKTARTLTARIVLAAAPDAATEYQVAVSNECDQWDFVLRGLGTPAQSAVLKHWSCADDAAVPPPAGVPATVTVRGSTLDFAVGYAAAGLRRGIAVTHVAAAASVEFAEAGVGMDPAADVADGDLAWGKVPFVLP